MQPQRCRMPPRKLWSWRLRSSFSWRSRPALKQMNAPRQQRQSSEETTQMKTGSRCRLLAATLPKAEPGARVRGAPEIVNNALQWKPARNLDPFSVLVKMNPNGVALFQQCLSTKPVVPVPIAQHAVQMLAPPAVAAALNAGQQILLGVGQTKVCPTCQQSLGVGAPSCFRCHSVFQQ